MTNRHVERSSRRLWAARVAGVLSVDDVCTMFRIIGAL